MVDHAALLMERVHDRLHNGKTDSAAAVLSRARLIDFVELGPDFVDILLRNRVSGIEDADADVLLLLPAADGNLLFSSRIMNGIAQVVRHDLLRHKFIRPNINGLCGTFRHRNAALPDEDIHRVQHAPDELCYVEALHRDRLVSGFQLV